MLSKKLGSMAFKRKRPKTKLKLIEKPALSTWVRRLTSWISQRRLSMTRRCLLFTTLSLAKESTSETNWLQSWKKTKSNLRCTKLKDIWMPSENAETLLSMTTVQSLWVVVMEVFMSALTGWWWEWMERRFLLVWFLMGWTLGGDRRGGCYGRWCARWQEGAGWATVGRITVAPPMLWAHRPTPEINQGRSNGPRL